MQGFIPNADIPLPTVEHQQRNTRQRDALRAALATACGPLLVKEILTEMRFQVDDVGVATVYRNLRRLVCTGEVLEIELPGESKRYQLAERGCTTFLRCVQCQRVLELPEPAQPPAPPPAFTVERYQVVMYGRCRYACPIRTRTD